MSVSRKNKCLNCGETFDGPEFWSFMLKLNARKVHCLRCQTENYFVKSTTFAAMLRTVLAVFLGLFAYILIEYALSHNGRILIFFLLFAIIVGVLTTKFFLTLFRWRYGVLSLDKKHKSLADYD